MTPRSGNVDLIGQRLGRYRLTASLGHGGMAEVFRAKDEDLNREVAIKVVLPAFAAEPELLQRFLREARVVASLEHPHILPIYDFGDHGGTPFLVLPLIRGGSLADLLEGQAQAPDRVIRWIRDLAQALDAAHAARVLHRDVKPGNVLVGRDQHLFLSDFGIARLSDATRLTQTGTVVGTPIYMAPEVAAGRSAEPASDLYSLAVMAYEMLCGDPPFDGENALSILHQHTTAAVPPIADRLGDRGHSIDRVLETALAKQPTERPLTCRAFAEQLAGQWTQDSAQRVSGQAPTLAMPREPTATPALRASSTSLPDLAAASQKDRQPGLKWGLVAGATASILGILAILSIDRLPLSTEGPLNDPPATEVSTMTSGLTALSDATAPEEPVSLEPSVPEQAPTAPSPTIPPSTTSSREPAAADPIGPPTWSERSRFQALRSFTSRMTESDFKKAQEAARKLNSQGPFAGPRSAVETYAQGGLTYLAGDLEGAEQALRQALRDRRFVRFWGPSPLMLLASSESKRHDFEPWELAIGYGDPQETAALTLDSLLGQQPDNLQFRAARAVVHRLDGEHASVIRHAEPVFSRLNSQDSKEVRSYLGQMIGDAYLGLGQGDKAVEWFQVAFEAGGAFRGLAALRAAEAARSIHRSDLAAEFLQRACDADIQQACRRLQGSSRRSRGKR